MRRAGANPAAMKREPLVPQNIDECRILGRIGQITASGTYVRSDRSLRHMLQFLTTGGTGTLA